MYCIVLSPLARPKSGKLFVVSMADEAINVSGAGKTPRKIMYMNVEAVDYKAQVRPTCKDQKNNTSIGLMQISVVGVTKAPFLCP